MNIATKTFKFYWTHLRRFWKLFLASILILPVNSLVGNYLPPLVLASILNKLSLHHYNAHNWWSVFGGQLILYFILIFLGSTLLWRLFDFFYWRLEGNVERSIQKQVFNHLVGQSADFHANEFAGSLVSSTNKLSSSYVRFADTTMFQVLPLFVGLLFVSIVMFSRSSLYTVLLLGFSLSYITLSFFVTKTVRQRGAAVAAAESHQTGILSDVLSNVMVVKSFTQEIAENKQFKVATNTTYQKLMSMMRAFQKQQLFLGSLTGIMTALSLVVAVLSVVIYKANLATAFLIFNYTSSISSQLFQFSNNALRNYNRAFGDASSMIDILAKPAEVQDPLKPEKSKIKDGNIVFNHVSFTHAGAFDTIFNDFSLDIQSGEKIGLVGFSGSGKTTLIRLLLRFSDIDSGSITIDGQDISLITQADLRDKIAYVPQEPLLFHRTIKENIAYAKPQASDQTIKQAAKLANAASFIDELPKKYETLVGERGIKLSGGQRQRVAIARAILKNAPILLLDEATSALDSESEIMIQQALWTLMEGKTAIVIAHRLSTVQKMDRIVVLQNGKIIEMGTHLDLLKQNGTYAKLWSHQSGGFLEEDS